MKLISDIINELVDTDKSISSPLLKTKVLASRIQNTNLFNWVSNELKGYDTSTCELPDYRIYGSSLIGDYINGHLQYTGQPIPTIGLDKEFEKTLRTSEFPQSISGLEHMRKDKDSESKVIEVIFTAEIIGLIQANWKKMGNPYLQLINVKRRTSTNAINEILSVVRNNLLDFMLKIDEEFGSLTEIEELKSKKSEIATIMSHTIINTSGDGNIVNTGNKAKINSTINIQKGNKEELKNHLMDIGVSEDDTKELIEIIDTDELNIEKGTFGENVNTWITKMLGKALNGSWNVGIGAAGSLLAEAIGKFYGM
ncbi:hypothetical protein Q4595_16035 [Wenyingzhuangia sp. 1_MG-2023]|nr:hypothetical protein [Wenyingzhuangia sp. 1_MG-2023]